MQMIRTLVVGVLALVAITGCSSGTNGTGADAGPDAGDTDTLPDAGGDEQCAGMPNFTSCEVVTEPDRSYDICIDGYCQSPGCGSFECNPPGPHFSLPDTGLALCYGGTVDSVECPGIAGDAMCAETQYCGQDAQYGWDASHGAEERFTRTEEVPGEPIAIDNVTGLVWQAEPSVQSRVWSEALASCDALSWAGQDDWRLPDIYELMSIVDLGRTDPTIDSTIINLVNYTSYWSSSYAGLDATGLIERAFAAFFGLGESSVYEIGYPKMVVCVRGEPATQPVARFARDEAVEGEPIVTDGTTGLEWQGCKAGQTGTDCLGTMDPMTWPEALAHCESLAWGGSDGWRLPNRMELWSIVDTRQETPGIDPNAFPGALEGSSALWSSTTYVGEWEIVDPENPDTDPARAWIMAYAYASTQSAAKAEDYTDSFGAFLGVRCMRSDS